ncbi:Protein of unknown function [Bacillus cytotoxicus]|uniref:Uncharacterized protein n=1 Tax=Bacillus cytotoxicus TaxID=580165 RepID=A0AAX2CF96_9BACI|nr:Protein of unknown function [Bacillus cytotoxicus]
MTKQFGVDKMKLKSVGDSKWMMSPTNWAVTALISFML